MGRVTSNSLGMSYAKEASLGVLPGSPDWRQVEPNEMGGWGRTISKASRSPINRARQRRKGLTTDADSGLEITADLTLSHLKDFAEGFAFARAVGGEVFTPSAATGSGYTVPAVSAGAAAKMLYGASSATTLVYARGFGLATNNGLNPLSGAVAAAATLIPVAGNAAETIDTTRVHEVAVAGVRAAAGDLTINSAGDLLSTALDFTTLGLTVGQYIHVGGLDVANQFFNTANLGFARIAFISANGLTLDKKDTTFVADDGTSTGAGGTAKRIDILFGQFVRNVPVGHVDYLETSYQFELESPNLGGGGASMYEYAVGNWADALSLELPLADKATITLGFVGKDTAIPTSTRATGASGTKLPSQTAGFSSSTDVARLRVQDVDETGLTTDFKGVTFTLTNNVAGEKVIGTLGPKYLNAGDLEVDVEASMLFTNADVIERIRCNKTVGLDFCVRNGDGGAYFDVPSATITGGEREYPMNASVSINTVVEAYEDPVLRSSFSISFFPVLPEVPCL